MTDNILTHQCNSCLQLKPATPEHFHFYPYGRIYDVCTSCLEQCDQKYIEAVERKAKEQVRRIELHYQKQNRPVAILRPRKPKINRRKDVEGWHTFADVELQYRSQKGKCWHCGKDLNYMYHVDHLIPIAKGGTNWPNNIVCSCAKCNFEKHARYCWEWNGRLF